MNLPTPSRLTLAEALAWLAEHGMSDVDAKAALPRAFRNGDIQTHGRSKDYYRHNTQRRISAITWDQAKVCWDRNGFAIPRRTSSRRKQDIEFLDVEVSTHDLSEWFSGNKQSNDASHISAPLPSPKHEKSVAGRKPKYDWDSFNNHLFETVSDEGWPSPLFEAEWQTDADLIRFMQEWCDSTWGNPVSKSTLKRRIAAAKIEFERKGFDVGS